MTLSPAPWETPWSCAHTGACPHVVTSPSALTRGATLGLIQTSEPEPYNKNKKMNSRHLRLMDDVQFFRKYFYHKSILECTAECSHFKLSKCVPPWPRPETTLSWCGLSSPSVGALCFVSLKINSNITSLATTTTARHSVTKCEVKK